MPWQPPCCTPCDGDLARARTLARRAREEGRRSQDLPAFWQTVASENTAVGLEHTQQNLDLWYRGREDMVALAAPRSWIAKMSQLVASAALTIGDVRLVRVMLHDALGSDPGPFAEVGIRAVATRLSMLTGRTGEATQHWARVEELAPRPSPYVNESVHAEMLLATGRPRPALEVCLAVLRAGADEVMRGEWLLPLAACALADLGATEAEVEQLEHEFPPAAPDGTIPSPIPVSGVVDEPRHRALRQAFEHRYVAELARARHSSEGPRCWERAATALDAVGLPWEAAYAWMPWGEVLLRADRVDRRAAARALRGAATCASCWRRPRCSIRSTRLPGPHASTSAPRRRPRPTSGRPT